MNTLAQAAHSRYTGLQAPPSPCYHKHAPQLWDIRNHKCIQTLTDRQDVYGTDEDSLLTAEYDTRRKLLVTGTSSLGTGLQASVLALACYAPTPARVVSASNGLACAKHLVLPRQLAIFKSITLSAGNLWPKVWPQTITAAASCGHKAPVTRVMYNSLFQEVCADCGPLPHCCASSVVQGCQMYKCGQ